MHASKSDNESTALQQALVKVRGGFMAVAVFSFFLNLLMLATPLYMLQVFQRVLGSGHLPTLLYLTIVTLFALLILGLLFTIRAWILGRVSGWLSGALSEPLIAASLKSTLAGSGTGAQPLRELGQLQTFIGGQGITAFFDSPWVPVFVAVIWLMHPWLGGLALISAIVLFILALLNELSTREPQQAANQEQARAHQFAETSLRNAEVVQAMGMSKGLLARWNKLHAGALAQQGIAGSRSATFLGLSRFVRLSVQVAILGLGAMLVLSGELTPGQMIAASILLGRALAPVEQSISAWRHFLAARSGYGRLQELLQKMPEPPPGIVLPPPKGLIQVDNLGFQPPTAEKPILRGLTFTLSPGETLGIVGPSAAGKSTLCRLLVGVWKPTVGSARLDSAEIHSWNREEFGRYVGYLPQDVELFSGTVRENIARMEETHDDEEVIAAARLADVHDMVLRLPNGYDTQIGVGGAMLSAGQRQRVGLARALFREPRVVVLDEPNSNLDRVGENALQQTLKTLQENGTTVIMVVHHARVLENTDKLMLIEEGRIAAFGPRDEVLARLGGNDRAEPAARSKFTVASAAPVPGQTS
ncbi:MAG: type I secretion system permease/ATPase [Gammaproteobacteria bacterium]|nr:MAG: type I secretion system permease/ATPase [Gammaproteobacteria bacterium]